MDPLFISVILMAMTIAGAFSAFVVILLIRNKKK